MAATSLAITLMEGGVIVYIPLSLIFLTCLGRMYFLAHHLLDCLAGAAVASALHWVCTLDWILPRLGTAEWYHPLGAVGALVIASQFRKSNQK